METPNLFIPHFYSILSQKNEAPGLFSITLKPDSNYQKPLPGQFNMLSLFGLGEIPISINLYSDSLLTHTVRSVGAITKAFETYKIGDPIGVRGPFGSAWPLHEISNKDVIVIAGGLGLVPLRWAIQEILSNIKKINSFSLLYGARNSKEILYKEELNEWKKNGEVYLTVDFGDSDWKGHVGVVTDLIDSLHFHPHNSIFFICGPEVMMRFTLQELLPLEIPKKQIYLSLERNMKCGVGLCGHCQLGPYFLCKEGPILSLDRLKGWFGTREI